MTTKLENWNARLEAYRTGKFKEVEGYSTATTLSVLLPAIQKFHDIHGISGDVGEIGVHHGRFFFALDCLRSSGERALVADVFDQQNLNVDRSGLGDRNIFEANLKGISNNPGSVGIFQGDTLSVEFHEYLAAERDRFRLLSIDGGHTVHHAMNDLRLAGKHIVPGGMVLLDDFCNIGDPFLQTGDRTAHDQQWGD